MIDINLLWILEKPVVSLKNILYLRAYLWFSLIKALDTLAHSFWTQFSVTWGSPLIDVINVLDFN